MWFVFPLLLLALDYHLLSGIVPLTSCNSIQVFLYTVNYLQVTNQFTLYKMSIAAFKIAIDIYKPLSCFFSSMFIKGNDIAWFLMRDFCILNVNICIRCDCYSGIVENVFCDQFNRRT